MLWSDRSAAEGLDPCRRERAAPATAPAMGPCPPAAAAVAPDPDFDEDPADEELPAEDAEAAAERPELAAEDNAPAAAPASLVLRLAALPEVPVAPEVAVSVSEELPLGLLAPASPVAPALLDAGLATAAPVVPPVPVAEVLDPPVLPDVAFPLARATESPLVPPLAEPVAGPLPPLETPTDDDAGAADGAGGAGAACPPPRATTNDRLATSPGTDGNVGHGYRRSKHGRLAGMPTVSHLAAARQLAERDPVVAALVAAAGPPRLRPPQESHFASLVRSVLYQQLAGSAAAAIHRRLITALGDVVEPESLLALPVETLRAVGLSANKAASIRDLAGKVLDGSVVLAPRVIARQADEQVIAALSTVRGIGRWTAQMFLMFQLRRLDVWPSGDLGVRRGYGLAWQVPMPSARVLEPLGDRFAPYRSVVAWYCWRSCELYASAPPSALTR